MPEIQANPTALQPGQAAAAPSGNPQQSTVLSQPQIDPNEYARYKADAEKYQREVDRVKGMLPLFQAAQQAGFKDPAIIGKYGEFHKKATENGLSPDQLMGIFTRQVAEQSDDPAGMSKAQIETMIGETVTKRQADFIRDQAEKQHNAGFAADHQGFVPAKLKAVKGFEDLDDSAAEFYAAAGEGLYYKGLKPYGEDHPLKGQYQPGGAEQLESVYGKLRAFRDSQRASQTLAIGAAARKGTPSNTPAGSNAGQGKPETNGSGGRPSRRERLEASAERVMAEKRR